MKKFYRTGLTAVETSAVFWSSIEFFIQAFFSLGTSLLLARFLTVEDFGFGAIYGLLFSLTYLTIDFGLNYSLQYFKELRKSSISVANTFSMIIAIILLLVWIILFLILKNYQVETHLNTTLGLIFIVSILMIPSNVIYSGILSKELKFSEISKINMLANFCTAVAVILVAYLFRNLIALILQMILPIILKPLLFRYTSGLKLGYKFNQKLFKILLFNGKYIYLAGIIDVIYTKFYAILLGRVGDIKQLGYFNRSEALSQYIGTSIGAVLSKFLYPYLRKLEGSVRSFELVYKGVAYVTAINGFFIIFFIRNSEQTVSFMLGQKWVTASPIFTILLLAVFFYPANVICINAINANGHSSIFFRLEFIKKLFSFFILIVGSYYSWIGLALAYLVASVFCTLANFSVLIRVFNYKLERFICGLAFGVSLSLVTYMILGDPFALKFTVILKYTFSILLICAMSLIELRSGFFVRKNKYI